MRSKLTWLNNNNMRSFSIYNLETMYENTYLCTVFFMVLDLRLTKDCGCRETTLSILNTFLIYHHTSKTSQNYFNTSIPRFKKTTSCDPLINFMYLFDLQLQVIQKKLTYYLQSSNCKFYHP